MQVTCRSCMLKLRKRKRIIGSIIIRHRHNGSKLEISSRISRAQTIGSFQTAIRDGEEYIMSARSKVWGACRALAIRNRPITTPSGSFSCAIPRQRWYSDQPANNGQATRPKNTTDSLQSSQQKPSPSPASGSSNVASESGDTATDRLSDEQLEQIFYGGRVASGTEGEGGLTPAQEESLYDGGVIPSPEEAEAVVAQGEEGLTSEDGGVGYKFPLPTRPYPADFHAKRRYHPVLDQLTRLLMRDGKLSVAQRVSLRYSKVADSEGFNMD